MILGSCPGSVAAGRDPETHGVVHNWPSVVQVREGLAGRDILVSSDSCGGPDAVHSDQVARCTVFHSDTLVQLASWLDGRCVKKQCGLVGLCFGGSVALDPRLSRVRTGVAAMRQDCNYQLDTTKLGRKGLRH